VSSKKALQIYASRSGNELMSSKENFFILFEDIRLYFLYIFCIFFRARTV